MIKVRATISAASVLLLGLAAWAQEFPIAEVAVDYTYSRVNPPNEFSRSAGLNGGVSYTLNLNQHLGIKADFQGYGSTQHAFNILPTTNFPQGTTGKVEGNLFTYIFGPEIKLRSPTWQPFFHTLFGESPNQCLSQFRSSICNINGVSKSSAAPSNNAFAAAFDCGLDVKLNKYVAFMPVEVDYVLTRFNSEFTSNQHNLRHSPGVALQ